MRGAFIFRIYLIMEKNKLIFGTFSAYLTQTIKTYSLSYWLRKCQKSVGEVAWRRLERVLLAILQKSRASLSLFLSQSVNLSCPQSF